MSLEFKQKKVIFNLPGVESYGSRATSDLPPVFVNKVLLEHSHAHLFTYVPGCFRVAAAELGNCKKDHMACKA